MSIRTTNQEDRSPEKSGGGITHVDVEDGGNDSPAAIIIGPDG
jgi:hypothetical protein